ncbi:MAG: NrtA/SsuA/CpmA family ABC transporter substrate-binding protein [Nitrospirae bacterium]|nr:NrtA/SsuA/CpmA family ABC transporter substrate-binding protein [Nitrospirota bacterium]
MKIKKVNIIVLFVIIVGIAGIIRLSQKKPQPEEFKGPRETVRIAIPRQPMNSLLIIAAELGLFSQEGLDVIAKDEYATGTGKRALEGLLAKDVDVATVSTMPIVFKSFERKDFSIIASHNSSGNDSRIVGRRDRGIKQPKDLKGKRIGAPKGTSMHFFLHMFLLKNGLSEKDVELSFKKIEEIPPALAGGEIDALSIREPYVQQSMRLLEDNAVVFAEPGMSLKTSNLVVLNKFIKDKPGAIERILRALIKAERFVKNQPAEAIKIVSRKLGISESELAAIWPEFNLRVSLEQSLLVTMEDQARWAIKNKLTDKTEVPNYLNFIYQDGLKAVKPEAVTIIR